MIKNRKLVTSLIIAGITLGNIGEINSNSSYKDVSTSHWAYDHIVEYTNRGILNGYEDGTFKPNQNITRAEFMKVMVEAFEVDSFGDRYLTDNPNNMSPMDFTDTYGHWARQFINMGASNGIYDYILDKTLNSNKLYRPNAFITREEASTMIATYLEIKDNDLNRIPYMYDYDKIVYWAKSSMEGLIENDVLHGYEDRTLRPQGNLTRAEAVKLVSKAEDVEVQPKKLNAHSTQAEFREHALNSGLVASSNGQWYASPENGMQCGYAQFFPDSEVEPGYATVNYHARWNIKDMPNEVARFRAFLSGYLTESQIDELYSQYLKFDFDKTFYYDGGVEVKVGAGCITIYLPF